MVNSHYEGEISRLKGLLGAAQAEVEIECFEKMDRESQFKATLEELEWVKSELAQSTKRTFQVEVMLGERLSQLGRTTEQCDIMAERLKALEVQPADLRTEEEKIKL